jgi:hypothetical protein
LFVVVACLATAVPASADVVLRIENGQVSLKATNATVREILAEWGRIGQTRIVNGDRIPGGPVSLELEGVTEEQALEVILRSVAGYVVAPRTSAVANASRYDRILVMPTSSPTRSAPPQPSFGQPGFPQPAFGQPGVGQPGGQPGFPPGFAQPGAPPAFQSPQFQQPGQFPPQFPQRPVDDDGGDVADEPAPNVVMPNAATPTFGAPLPPGTRPAPGQMPVGVAVPGMVVPTPQPQPGQPGAVQRPNEP